MGLLTNILLAPFLGPVWGTRWTLEKVDRVVREELTDDTPIKEDLMALQLQLEMGEIDDASTSAGKRRFSATPRSARGRDKYGMSTAWARSRRGRRRDRYRRRPNR